MLLSVGTAGSAQCQIHHQGVQCATVCGYSRQCTVLDPSSRSLVCYCLWVQQVVHSARSIIKEFSMLLSVGTAGSAQCQIHHQGVQCATVCGYSRQCTVLDPSSRSLVCYCLWVQQVVHSARSIIKEFSVLLSVGTAGSAQCQIHHQGVQCATVCGYSRQCTVLDPSSRSLVCYCLWVQQVVHSARSIIKEFSVLLSVGTAGSAQCQIHHQGVQCATVCGYSRQCTVLDPSSRSLVCYCLWVQQVVHSARSIIKEFSMLLSAGTAGSAQCQIHHQGVQCATVCGYSRQCTVLDPSSRSLVCYCLRVQQVVHSARSIIKEFSVLLSAGTAGSAQCQIHHQGVQCATVCGYSRQCTVLDPSSRSLVCYCLRVQQVVHSARSIIKEFSVLLSVGTAGSAQCQIHHQGVQYATVCGYSRQCTVLDPSSRSLVCYCLWVQQVVHSARSIIKEFSVLLSVGTAGSAQCQIHHQGVQCATVCGYSRQCTVLDPSSRSLVCYCLWVQQVVHSARSIIKEFSVLLSVGTAGSAQCQIHHQGVQCATVCGYSRQCTVLDPSSRSLVCYCLWVQQVVRSARSIIKEFSVLLSVGTAGSAQCQIHHQGVQCATVCGYSRQCTVLDPSSRSLVCYCLWVQQVVHSARSIIKEFSMLLSVGTAGSAQCQIHHQGVQCATVCGYSRQCAVLDPSSRSLVCYCLWVQQVVHSARSIIKEFSVLLSVGTAGSAQCQIHHQGVQCATVCGYSRQCTVLDPSSRSLVCYCLWVQQVVHSARSIIKEFSVLLSVGTAGSAQCQIHHQGVQCATVCGYSRQCTVLDPSSRSLVCYCLWVQQVVHSARSIIKEFSATVCGYSRQCTVLDPSSRSLVCYCLWVQQVVHSARSIIKEFSMLLSVGTAGSAQCQIHHQGVQCATVCGYSRQCTVLDPSSRSLVCYCLWVQQVVHSARSIIKEFSVLLSVGTAGSAQCQIHHQGVQCATVCGYSRQCTVLDPSSRSLVCYCLWVQQVVHSARSIIKEFSVLLSAGTAGSAQCQIHHQGVQCATVCGYSRQCTVLDPSSRSLVCYCLRVQQVVHSARSIIKEFSVLLSVGTAGSAQCQIHHQGVQYATVCGYSRQCAVLDPSSRSLVCYCLRVQQVVHSARSIIKEFSVLLSVGTAGSAQCQIHHQGVQCATVCGYSRQCTVLDPSSRSLVCYCLRVQQVVHSARSIIKEFSVLLSVGTAGSAQCQIHHQGVQCATVCGYSRQCTVLDPSSRSLVCYCLWVQQVVHIARSIIKEFSVLLSVGTAGSAQCQIHHQGVQCATVCGHLIQQNHQIDPLKIVPTNSFHILE